MTKTVLVVGGYGVFGGRLAAHLAKDPELDVLVAGRSLSRAEEFCAIHGGRPVQFDIDAPDLSATVQQLNPFAVVDAAGPFQAYIEDPYRLAYAAIYAGAHYLDLSDDAEFTRGIADLDGAASANKVVALSGVSSVPALSSAVVKELTRSLSSVHVIETAILPGNRAPRGASLVRAVFGQAGKPVAVVRGGERTDACAWGDLHRIRINVPGRPAISTRFASFIGAPDLTLFPKRYDALSVLFRAGLELKILHLGLYALSLPVRWGLIKSIAFLAEPLRLLADRLSALGTDRGGMEVRVAGTDGAGRARDFRWHLIAEAGDGPNIPALPAALMIEKLAAETVKAGARPCLEEFALAEADRILRKYDIHWYTKEITFEPLFAALLREDFDLLPGPLRDLHTVIDRRVWSGEARIERGTSALSRLAGWIGRFPAAGERVPVKVTMDRQGNHERWTREFGRSRFTSTLRRSSVGQSDRGRTGALVERFGAFIFGVSLRASEATLDYPVVGASFLGVPLPAFLTPVSQTTEFVDDTGRCRFDVRISLPIGGLVVHYTGWLEARGAGAIASPSPANAA